MTFQIELRKIHVNNSLSDETLCYSATLYVGGKYVGTVGNRGHGGCDEQHISPDSGWTLAALNKECAAHYPQLSMKEYGMDDLPATLELVCQNIVSKQSEIKRIKRTMISKVVVKKGDSFLEYRWKGVRQVTQGHINAIRTKYPDVVVLNGMSDQQLAEVL
jgi:hypothetical protein